MGKIKLTKALKAKILKALHEGILDTNDFPELTGSNDQGYQKLDLSIYSEDEKNLLLQIARKSSQEIYQKTK